MSLWTLCITWTRTLRDPIEAEIVKRVDIVDKVDKVDYVDNLDLVENLDIYNNKYPPPP